MAEVVAPGHGRHSSNITAMAIPGGPTIEMIPNPEFSFPIRQVPGSPTHRRRTPNDNARPSSMHANPPPSQSGLAAHRKTASTLPSFTFNATDASGLQQTPNTSAPTTPEEEAPLTPQRRGHRRGGSEFVGGDSRLGMANAMSSSPTKPNALPLPAPAPGPPADRSRHSHRRSAAISSHDLSNIMRPTEAAPRLSSSLPTTPMELPGQSPPLDRATSAPDVIQDPFGPSLEEQATRPPSRPRVGFSDNVEIIPRPLSTISSETESSMSTIRGHSVNNSISSVLSLGTPSPPSTRPSRASLSAPLEDEPKPRAKSSIEISRRVEKEGEWLKSRSSQSLKRPLSESAAAPPPPKTTFAEPQAPARRRNLHKKRQSLSYALGLDRRRSEPAIGMAADDPTRHSAISLDSLSGVSDGPACPVESISSTKRLKAWATSKMSKKPKEMNRAVSESSSRSSMRPDSAGNTFVAGRVMPPAAPAVETDLDAVLGTETPKADRERPVSPSQPRIEVSGASPTFPSPKQSWRDDDDDDDGAMLDLDAALGPFKTPSMGSAQRPRKELHSSRLNRDFTGPGGHYHRRAESAPALPPFDSSRVSTPSQSSMADVFEEEEETDEEDEAPARAQKPGRTKSMPEEETGIGISVVDSANAGAAGHWNLAAEDGLGIQRGEWEPERPGTSYSNAASRLSTSGTDRRGSSIIEETIFEEVSPVEPPTATGIEIVDAEDEPRASSLTKSSDSSETPTLLGAAAANLMPASDGPHSMTTPDTYQTSTFSSPDFNRRQTSFDASRVGTAASSIADTRTTSSCTTGEQGSEVRMSVDDVPSLTSSRSTMLSTAQANHSQRNISDRTPSASSASDRVAAAERRSKRSSIASLSQLLSSRSKDHDEVRPKTSADPSPHPTPAKKKEHRLKKLMFWKAKHTGSNKGSSRPPT